jgi:hypothetical protein
MSGMVQSRNNVKVIAQQVSCVMVINRSAGEKICSDGPDLVTVRAKDRLNFRFHTFIRSGKDNTGRQAELKLSPLTGFLAFAYLPSEFEPSLPP